MKEYTGRLTPEGARLAFVVGRFNSFITASLLDGAREAMARAGVDQASTVVVRVPGSMEIPLAAARLARSGRFDAVICLGAVIRGATPHFDYVAGECAKGIAQVGLETGIPVINGVLTTDTIEQAVERAGTKAGNKGEDAVLAALEMVDLLRQLDGDLGAL